MAGAEWEWFPVSDYYNIAWVGMLVPNSHEPGAFGSRMENNTFYPVHLLPLEVAIKLVEWKNELARQWSDARRQGEGAGQT
jgi:hypothetical protein